MLKDVSSYLWREERGLVLVLALAVLATIYAIAPIHRGETGIEYKTASLKEKHRFSLWESTPGMRVHTFVVFQNSRRICARWMYWQPCLFQENGRIVRSYHAIGSVAPFVTEVKSMASPSQVRLFRHFFG